jgi:hypothetical protein
VCDIYRWTYHEISSILPLALRIARHQSSDMEVCEHSGNLTFWWRLLGLALGTLITDEIMVNRILRGNINLIQIRYSDFLMEVTELHVLIPWSKVKATDKKARCMHALAWTVQTSHVSQFITLRFLWGC